MASISREANGRRSIQFVGPDGKRRTVRLGNVPQKTAEGVKVKVEHLLAAVVTGHALDSETARWVEERDEVLYAKLAAVGLIAERESVELGRFIDRYIQGRKDVKERTRNRLSNTRRHLVEFFGEHKKLADVTPGSADDWRIHLVDSGLKPATIGKLVKNARQFFAAAIRKRLASGNPFAAVKAPQQVNASRFYFVTESMTARVLEACPNAEWRLIVALARYGGLRTPSETLALRWGDIDWDRGRFRVHSTKTEHHEGHQSRQVPLFAELRPHLEQAFEEAADGSEFVIAGRRANSANLRTRFERIIRRAGLEPWPKLFQNLRSSRETELTKKYPLHVVCAWIGNSQPVAAKHYLQVTDEDFATAVGGQWASNSCPQRAAESGAVNGQKAVQKPMQQPAAADRSESHPEGNPCSDNGLRRSDAAPCFLPQEEPIPPRGVEHTPKPAVETRFSIQTVAESAAHGTARLTTRARCKARSAVEANHQEILRFPAAGLGLETGPGRLLQSWVYQGDTS